jgi:hypothetical protein
LRESRVSLPPAIDADRLKKSTTARLTYSGQITNKGLSVFADIPSFHMFVGFGD